MKLTITVQGEQGETFAEIKDAAQTWIDFQIAHNEWVFVRAEASPKTRAITITATRKTQ